MCSDLEKSKDQYRTFVKHMCEELCSESVVDKYFAKLRKEFMLKRQAPQEILEPNEIDEGAEDIKAGWQSDDEEESQQKESSSSLSDSDQESKEDESSEPIQEMFTEVKLVSKHAAFLRQSAKGKHWLYYCTQN